MRDATNSQYSGVFAGLNAADVEAILHVATVLSLERGEVVLGPDDGADRLYLLHQGHVKTYTLSLEGKEKITHILGPGDAFGGLIFGRSDASSSWAEALDDVIVSSLDEAAFTHYARTRPDVWLGLLRYIAGHHAADIRRMRSLIHTNADNRLVLTLLDLTDRLGGTDAEEFELPMWLTHEELGNIIGVARSTASTLVSELRRAGVLGGKGRKLIISRRAAEQFVGEGHV